MKYDHGMTEMRNYLFVIMVAVPLCACNVGSSMLTQSTANEAVVNLRYAQDQRTGLCYAVRLTNGPDHSPIVTNVPCDPKVLRLIEQQYPQ